MLIDQDMNYELYRHEQQTYKFNTAKHKAQSQSKAKAKERAEAERKEEKEKPRLRLSGLWALGRLVLGVIHYSLFAITKKTATVIKIV